MSQTKEDVIDKLKKECNDNDHFPSALKAFVQFAMSFDNLETRLTMIIGFVFAASEKLDDNNMRQISVAFANAIGMALDDLNFMSEITDGIEKKMKGYMDRKDKDSTDENIDGATDENIDGATVDLVKEYMDKNIKDSTDENIDGATDDLVNETMK